MSVTFSIATEADAHSITGLRRQIWETTYRGIYPDALLDHYDREAYRKKDLERIADPLHAVYLIREGETPVGYFSYRLADTPHITSLYILKAYQRKGIGTAVFRHIRTFCRKRGIQTFTCNCNVHNHPAQAFYRRMGGEVIAVDAGHANKREDQITYRFPI